MSRALLLSFVFLALAILFSIAIGSVYIPLNNLWNILHGEGSAAMQSIIWQIRMPRTALVILTGAALSVSGASYQGLFRNPLADPYLIGVASGAGLGAVIAMSFQPSFTFWGLMTIPLAAFTSALLTVFVVYFLARIGRTIPTTNLILAGVAVSSFATSLTSFLMLRSTDEIRRALGWMMGGSFQTGWMSVFVILPFIALGAAFLLFNGHALNLLQFGDEQARQLGLNVNHARTRILISASLVTAAGVAFSGIIGFLGLIVPHVIRLWFGADYRKILPLSLINGASILLLVDILARVLLAPQEIPLGIITALAGAPFFLWVLRRSKNQGYW